MEARIGILTVSDTRSSGENEDLSGPAVAKALAEAGFFNFSAAIVADEIGAIQSAIKDLATDCAAVLTTGGTGFAERDVTPEATAAMLDRRADNVSELIRLKGAEKTPLSYLSRGVAGVYGQTLVVNLPGSPKGATEAVQAIAPLLEHILLALSGEGCPH